MKYERLGLCGSLWNPFCLNKSPRRHWSHVWGGGGETPAVLSEGRPIIYTVASKLILYCVFPVAVLYFIQTHSFYIIRWFSLGKKVLTILIIYINAI